MNMNNNDYYREWFKKKVSKRKDNIQRMPVHCVSELKLSHV